MTNHSKEDNQIGIQNKNKYFNYTLIRRGIIIFLAITLIAFTVVFLYNNTEESLAALQNIRPIYFVMVLLLVFFDWIIGAYRNQIFIKRLNPSIPFKVAFNANLANIFMGAVTPSQTGGGPMHLYMLNRGGVKLADGIVLSIINYISTIIILFISVGLSLYYLKNQDFSDSLITIVKSSYAIFSSLILLVALGLIAPSWIGRRLQNLGSLLGKLFSSHKKKIESLAQKAAVKLYEYNETIILFVRKNPILLVYSLIYTFILYFNKYLIGFVVVIGLGYEVDFWSVIAIHAVLVFLTYFAPSPGASGVAEISLSFMMAQMIPESGIPVFIVLQRFFSFLLPAAVGSIIVLRELNLHTKE